MAQANEAAPEKNAPKSSAPEKPATAKTRAKTTTARKEPARSSARRGSSSSGSRADVGDTYTCEVCGLSLVVDETCECIEAHDILCCEQPMKKTSRAGAK